MFNGIFDPWQIAYNREGRLGPGQRLIIFLSGGLVILIGAVGILTIAILLYSLLVEKKVFAAQDVIFILIFVFGGLLFFYYGWKKATLALSPRNIQRTECDYRRLRQMRIGVLYDFNRGIAMMVDIDGRKYVLSFLQAVTFLFRRGRVALYYIDWEYDREVVNFEFLPPGRERKK